MSETNTNPNQVHSTEIASLAVTFENDTPVHDCWNRIGVEGNGTCRELAKYIHCRNCPVYSAAGLQLLDRPIPAEHRRERAEHYAQRKNFARPERVSVVVFRLAAEWFALPTTVFQEVAEQRPMHSLPQRRRGLALGLVNVRGELLVCASAARLLGLEETDDSSGLPANEDLPGKGLTKTKRSSNRFLVTVWEGQRLVFPVDEVPGIQRFMRDELQATPATLGSAHSYSEGVFVWGEHPVGLLNVGTFFGALNQGLA